jgi:hypothetical protein
MLPLWAGSGSNAQSEYNGRGSITAVRLALICGGTIPCQPVVVCRPGCRLEPDG